MKEALLIVLTVAMTVILAVFIVQSYYDERSKE